MHFAPQSVLLILGMSTIQLYIASLFCCVAGLAYHIPSSRSFGRLFQRFDARPRGVLSHIGELGHLQSQPFGFVEIGLCVLFKALSLEYTFCPSIMCGGQDIA